MARNESSPFEGTDRVGDFFAPFFTVRFLTTTTQQGTEVDAETGAETTKEIQESATVTVSAGDTEIVFAEDDRTKTFRSYATKLTLTNKGGGATMVELVLEPPFEDALFITENRLLQFNSLMVIEWGWSSDSRQNAIISDKHVFVILQPKLDMKGTEISITITGIDLFSYSSTKRETRTVFNRTKPSEDGTTYTSDYMILDSIAKKNNMRLNTSLAPIVSVTTTPGPFGAPLVKVTPTDLPIHQKKPKDKDDATSIEQYEKDYQFFSRICEMNRCDFFVIGDTIFIVDQNIARVQKIAYRLVFWNQPQEANDIPVLSFSTQSIPALFFPAESKEVTHKTVDEDSQTTNSRKIDPQTASNFEAMGPRGAGGKAEADGRTIRISEDISVIPNPAFKTNETGKMVSTPGGKANDQEHVERLARDANSLCNTNAEATIPGVPNIVPMQVVRVEGVGKVFSGAYIVTQVVHRLTTDGYECDLSLIRESSTGDEAAGKGVRPVTGGNDPSERSPGGQGVEPDDAGNA